jgi:L-ascorbate metabolism protein UlaG (beta-lactamase superfamily)
MTFVGTATTLLRIGSFTLLTDPNFLHAGDRAPLGYGLYSRRRTDPAMEIEQLPPLDAVVLSHLHGDHFDQVCRDRLPRSLSVITTPHAERRLHRWGFGATTGLRHWSDMTLRRGGQVLRVTSVPAQHGPALVNRLMPQTMGSVIDLEEEGKRKFRVYITGDTLNRPRLRQIVERFDDIDVMLIHLGGTKVLGMLLTMDGAQGAHLLERVRPATTLPIHYDDYGVFRSGLADFTREVEARNLSHLVRPWGRGDTVGLPFRTTEPGSVDRPRSTTDPQAHDESDAETVEGR